MENPKRHYEFTLAGFVPDELGDSPTVYLNKELLLPNDSLKVVNHSPDGFSWGYLGSGPAQLAAAIMLKLTGKVDGYQRLKTVLIAWLPYGRNFEVNVKMDCETIDDRVGTTDVMVLFEGRKKTVSFNLRGDFQTGEVFFNDYKLPDKYLWGLVAREQNPAKQIAELVVNELYGATTVIPQKVSLVESIRYYIATRVIYKLVTERDFNITVDLVYDIDKDMLVSLNFKEQPIENED